MKLSILQVWGVAFISAFILIAGAHLLSGKDTLGSYAGFAAYDCSVSTSTTVVVNPQSTTILAEHSRRAWASIQQPRNATNTIALSFNEGASAVANGGFQLSIGTSSSPINEITFGLNTDFPYTGAVTGIASAGTTTVLVTECRYDR